MTFADHDARTMKPTDVFAGLPENTYWSSFIGALVLDAPGREPQSVNWSGGLRSHFGAINFGQSLKLPVFVPKPKRPTFVHEYSLQPKAVSRVWHVSEGVFDVFMTDEYRNALAGTS